MNEQIEQELHDALTAELKGLSSSIAVRLDGIDYAARQRRIYRHLGPAKNRQTETILTVLASPRCGWS